jgi:hypothetical protein
MKAKRTPQAVCLAAACMGGVLVLQLLHARKRDQALTLYRQIMNSSLRFLTDI